MLHNICYNCKKQNKNLINDFGDLFCDYVCLIEFHEFLIERKEKQWDLKIIKCAHCSGQVNQHYHHSYHLNYEKFYLCCLECLVPWMQKMEIDDEWFDKEHERYEEIIKKTLIELANSQDNSYIKTALDISIKK